MTFDQWIEEDFGGAVETPDQKAQARYGSKKAAYDFGQGEMLSDLRQALGWQGGTVEQVVAEVGRLRSLERGNSIEVEIVCNGEVHYRRPLRDPMVVDALRTPGYSIRVPTVGAGKTFLVQGVAALLPEHGEAKHET